MEKREDPKEFGEKSKEILKGKNETWEPFGMYFYSFLYTI